MDKRQIKTKRSIKNAFLKIRSKKSIEKITIKELSDEAEISKATFYLHYKDIYDLSASLGTEIIENILRGISDPNSILDDPALFIREFINACIAEKNMIKILFSGSQNYILADSLEAAIKNFILELHPEYREDLSFNIQLSFTIKGAYYAFIDHLDQFESYTLIEELCKISSRHPFF